MEPISLSGLVNLGYFAIGLLAVYGVVRYANHSGITGKSFHLATWLDAIADSDAEGRPGPNANRIAMAVVILAMLVAGAVLASAFIGG
uniref:Putative hydrophobe/amphiphile efflux-1 HAE1 n=1 Tax=uncultured bacterium 878 TaxID=548895 RepID=B8R8L8_9BACT|nr:putative hydrophobe/amphiphile efflux-1 HAE1 [uncultured bacterium 878]